MVVPENIFKFVTRLSATTKAFLGGCAEGGKITGRQRRKFQSFWNRRRVGEAIWSRKSRVVSDAGKADGS